MKIIRSVKCSLKFVTPSKRQILADLRQEYARVVNFFIGYFWHHGLIAKGRLLKPIVDLPTTWLSARLRKVAAREALDLCRAQKQAGRDIMPTHSGRSMHVSSTIARLKLAQRATAFDAWLELRCLGKEIQLDLPIRRHKHFHKWAARGRRLQSFIITSDYVQFSFEIETGPKKEPRKLLGIDTGINALATTSDREKIGSDIKPLVEAIKRCAHGSKRQQRRRRALRQRMDEVAKEVCQKVDLVVVERLQRMNHQTKLTRRVSQSMRRTLGAWAYRYWLRRLQMTAEQDRVSFRSVPPQRTSQRCHVCSHSERRNRQGELFRCQECGYTGDADVNAARNILGRFLTGAYGPGCQTSSVE